MNKKNKIRCHFIIQSLGRAGAETQVVDVVNNLDDNLFEKHVFTYNQVQEQLHRLNHNTVKSYNIPRCNKFDIEPIRRIAKLIDREEIDVIHCTLQFSLLLAWLARFLSKRKPPLVVAIHTTLTRSFKEEMQNRFIYRHLLQRCATVIYVCENQHLHRINKFPSLAYNSRTIHNGINVKYFDPENWKTAGASLRKELGIPSDTTVISCLARFRPEKKHSHLVEAFSKLNGQYYLALAGDGETLPVIEKMVKDKGLSDRVKFLGLVDDVRPLLAMSNLTILTSTAVETFSIAMLESMSMAVPMLATDLGGMSECVIPGETGFLVKPGDIDDLTRTLEGAVQQDTTELRRIGLLARKHVTNCFTEELMVTHTTNVLLKAVHVLHV